MLPSCYCMYKGGFLYKLVIKEHNKESADRIVQVMIN